MTPQDLSALYPRLFHVTDPEAWPSIKRLGLLSTSHLLDLLEVKKHRRAEVEEQRRADCIAIDHPVHGRIVFNDNRPLSFPALKSCLEDKLGPTDWMRILNARVFFWADEDGLRRLLRARFNRTRKRMVIVVDTLRLAQSYSDSLDLSPINSGSTIRRPARRGKTTFTPLLRLTYEEWRRQRGRRHKILEVTIDGGIPDICQYILETRLTSANAT